MPRLVCQALQGFRDLRVLKGLWELWEPEEIQETKEQLDLLVHQGPQVPPLGHRRRHLRLMVHQLVQQVKLVFKDHQGPREQ